MPTEDHAPRLVDPNRVPTRPIAFERLQPVPWRHSKVAQVVGLVEVQYLPSSRLVEGGWQPPDCGGAPVVEHVFGEPIAERLDHGFYIITT
jgi:hypothetical protein